MNVDRKRCTTCPRTMSADDAHRRCQSCRRGADAMTAASRKRRAMLWARRELGLHVGRLR